MSPETAKIDTLEAPETSERDVDGLATLFASSLSRFYYLHCPKQKEEELQKLIFDAFKDQYLEQALPISAAAWRDGFRYIKRPEHSSERKLFNPKWSCEYPPYNPEPAELFEELILEGKDILINDTEIEKFCDWFDQIEQDFS